MILYNVTIKIDNDVEEEWLDWIKINYIKKVINTNLFFDFKLYRLLNDSDKDGSTYAIQFFANDLSEVETYLNNYAAEISEHHRQKFIHKHVAFMTLLESVF